MSLVGDSWKVLKIAASDLHHLEMSNAGSALAATNYRIVTGLQQVVAGNFTCVPLTLAYRNGNGNRMLLMDIVNRHSHRFAKHCVQGRE